MPAIVLHHLELSRSTRVLWALEELGLDYEIKTYKRDKNFRADPALKQVHPLGKSPVVVADGLILAESAAILEYLVDIGDGTLRPETAQERQNVRYWLHFAEGTLMPTLLMSLVHGTAIDKVPFFIKPVVKGILGTIDGAFTNPEIIRNMGFVEQTLSGQPWLTGERFTTADIQMSYGLQAGVKRAPKGQSYPKIQAYIQRFEARPAYKKAVEIGGSPMPE
ncbi:MAG: glutathione S-transferase [Cognaticolwellia sp.]|jgi:glutathione S-transferase